MLNGSPTDNNATLFAEGYNSVLDPKFKDGSFKKAADQSVPDWDNQKALTIFEQMLAKPNNDIQGVLAANDGLGNAAIQALKARKLEQLPVTGQDATPQGLQNILAGDQCMTVYKAVKKEADAAAAIAIALAQGKEPTTVNGKTNDGKRDVPSVLLTPEAITKENVGRPDQGQLRDLRRGVHRQVQAAVHRRGHRAHVLGIESAGEGASRTGRPRTRRPIQEEEKQ